MENLEDQLDNKINLDVIASHFPKKEDTVETETKIESKQRPSRQLTQDEISLCRKIFDVLDKNGDDTISTDYLSAILYQSDVIEESLKEVDPDNTGKINFQGVLQLYQKQDPVIEDKEVNIKK